MRYLCITSPSFQGTQYIGYIRFQHTHHSPRRFILSRVLKAPLNKRLYVISKHNFCNYPRHCVEKKAPNLHFVKYFSCKTAMLPSSPYMDSIDKKTFCVPPSTNIFLQTIVLQFYKGLHRGV